MKIRDSETVVTGERPLRSALLEVAGEGDGWCRWETVPSVGPEFVGVLGRGFV